MRVTGSTIGISDPVFRRFGLRLFFFLFRSVILFVFYRVVLLVCRQLSRCLLRCLLDCLLISLSVHAYVSLCIFFSLLSFSCDDVFFRFVFPPLCFDLLFSCDGHLVPFLYICIYIFFSLSSFIFVFGLTFLCPQVVPGRCLLCDPFSLLSFSCDRVFFPFPLTCSFLVMVTFSLSYLFFFLSFIFVFGLTFSCPPVVPGRCFLSNPFPLSETARRPRPRCPSLQASRP